jgi:hypothetical protein
MSYDKVLEQLKTYVPPLYTEFLESHELIKSLAHKTSELEQLIKDEIRYYLDGGGEEYFKLFQLYKLFNYEPTELEKSRIAKVVLTSWKKFNATSLNNLSRAYTGGSVRTEFKYLESKLMIFFTDLPGVPPNITALQKVIEQRIPAHLIYEIIFLYITWEIFDSYDYTWATWDSKELNWKEWEEYALGG